eukprot:TRINITY_DN10364_c0_g2_i1.p1 TRINITY_DN10364_c0_g2~~TRINITY_DN10364_c0_g2_i1.p1  ORF type:complete len:601 (+),score=215.78 TRINITY_DN10364_c0_g2_i1:1064-2866(+)
MTEFGKTVKLVDALEKNVDAWCAGLAALAAADVTARQAEAAAALATLRTGEVAGKVAKFRAKAEEPAETRVYGEGMVAKVRAFVDRVEALAGRVEEHLLVPLGEAAAAAAARAARVAELEKALLETVAEEGRRRRVVEWEACEGGFAEGLVVAREWVWEVDEAWQAFTAELRRREKRAAEKERKKQKKKTQQKEILDANERKLRREREAHAAQREEDFARAVLILTHKEGKARDAITSEYYMGRPMPPRGASGRASPSGRVSPMGRRTPPRKARSRSTSPNRDEPRAVAASLSQLPPAVMNLEFEVEPVSHSAQVLLRNERHSVAIELYRCLLRVRDLAAPAPFELAEELLTDQKARKRYMKARPPQAGKGVLHFDPVEEERSASGGDEDDDALFGSDSGEDGPLAVGGLEYYPVETYSDSDDDEDYTTLPTSVPSLEFLRPLLDGCVVVFMSVGGSFAGGVFMAGDCVVHTTFHRYICRKKQGGRQSNHEGRSDTVGSQMRARHEVRFKELLAQVLHTWKTPLSHAAAIFLHAPGAVNRQPFFAPPALPASCKGAPFVMSKKDPRILPVPLSTHKPSFAEVKRVYEAMTECQYTHQEAL